MPLVCFISLSEQDIFTVNSIAAKKKEFFGQGLMSATATPPTLGVAGSGDKTLGTGFVTSALFYTTAF